MLALRCGFGVPGDAGAVVDVEPKATVLVRLAEAELRASETEFGGLLEEGEGVGFVWDDFLADCRVAVGGLVESGELVQGVRVVDVCALGGAFQPGDCFAYVARNAEEAT